MLTRIILREAQYVDGGYRDISGEYTYDFPAGSVLAVSNWHRHVCSDNAMIDSGAMETVTWWNEEASRTEEITVDEGRTNSYLRTPPVDATDEVKAKAAAYAKVVNWAEGNISKCRDAERAAKTASEGDQVEVFKGRKVPKGTYTISRIGVGDWGPYYHLRDAKGLPHYYISRDNCRLVKKPDYSGIEFAEFFGECTNHNYTAMGVLADFLQECGDDRGRYLFAYWDLKTAKTEYAYA